MKNRYLSSALCLMGLLCALPVTAQEKSDTDVLNGLPKFIEEQMSKWKIPGVAVAVVKDGEIMMMQGFGYRDLETREPVTPRTLFSIGSTTKAFTSLALGILVDDGKMEWDKPVREYMPDFTLKDEFATLHATPRDLVTHRTGLPRHDLVWYASELRREELYHRLRFLEPSAELREIMQYNNLVYMTAGVLIGKVSGKTWEKFVSERIFEPLGMQRSFFDGPPEGDSDFASPYHLTDGEPKKVPFYRGWAVGPAGSIYASVEDMTKWLLLHLSGGKVGDKRIVSEGTLREMHKPQVVMEYGASEEIPLATYGMGWVVQTYRGQMYVWHNGSIDGFYAFIGFLPYKKLGVVILTNMDEIGVLPEILSRRVFDRALGLDEIDWSARMTEQRKKALEAREKANVSSGAGRREGTSPSHPLADYAGTFSHPAYQEVKIELNDGKLLAHIRGLAGELKHFHYDVFSLKLGEFPEIRVTFEMNPNGDIVSLSMPLQPGVEPIVFTRIGEEALKTAEYLERFAGDYELAGITVKIELRGGKSLFAIVPGQPAYELEPVKENSFRIKTLEGYSLEFKTDEQGKVVEVVFHQPEGSYTAKRKS
jgi:CubicO group peptidase (beta-lactamase class C family)